MPVPETLADGLRAKLGDLTWPIIRDKVDDVVTATERDIVEAIKIDLRAHETGGRTQRSRGLAAALSGQFGRWNRAGAGWGKTMRVSQGGGGALRRERRHKASCGNRTGCRPRRRVAANRAPT